MKLNGFIGQAYTLASLNVNCQRCVNWYPEKDESGASKEGLIAFLKATPGYRKIFELGTGPIRLIHMDGLQNDDGTYFQLNRLFVVSGSEVFCLTFGDAGWAGTDAAIGSLGTSSGPVSAASITQNYGATVFVDGSTENYVYHKPNSSTENFQTFTAAGYVPVQRATQVKWTDGYLIFIVENSNQFYVSEWNSLNVDALSFATAEGNPDTIVALEILDRAAWFLNGKTVEIWPNTGNADFPFERQAFIENGCVAPFSVGKIGGSILWLGQDATGRGIVFQASGPQHQRISTHAVEQAIAGYDNIEDARAYTYQDEGHHFYCLNFETTTWCYDLTTGAWHERCYLNDGELERDRIQCHAYFPNYGGHIGGDYQNAKIYLFDNSYYTHDAALIKRLRASPHISSGKKNIKFKRLEIGVETGVGLDGASTSQGHDPQMMLRFSDDGGHTWSGEKWRSLGKIGKYKTRVKFEQLGIGRDRVFEVSMTDPVKAVLIDADIDAEECLR